MMKVLVELGEPILRAREADLKSFDLAEPAFILCFGDAVDEVVPDFHEAVAQGGVGAKEGTADAGVFVNAGGAVGTGAGGVRSGRGSLPVRLGLLPEVRTASMKISPSGHRLPVIRRAPVHLVSTA
ncbi:hypothetical protein [Streptomyces sp. NBC_00154]|uniref:hypothetical protein n=1 Tax=Streptomyces sp. NBC_00154 TaxID=2975670 RepID=UPI00224E9F66|nr:hypothetical protein [Streptomyces sp. NBC_00154]